MLVSAIRKSESWDIVIASEAKQSRSAKTAGLLRRFAPRNDTSCRSIHAEAEGADADADTRSVTIAIARLGVVGRPIIVDRPIVVARRIGAVHGAIAARVPAASVAIADDADIVNEAFVQHSRFVIGAERHGGGAADCDCAERRCHKQWQSEGLHEISPVGEAGTAARGVPIQIGAEAGTSTPPDRYCS